MRQLSIILIPPAIAAAIAGCAPLPLGSNDDPTTLNSLLASTSAPGGPAVGASISDEPPPSGETSPPTELTLTFGGDVSGSGAYHLFELGGGLPGDEWTVELTEIFAGPFVVVLFDVDENLLMRTYMYSGNPLHHVLRAATDQVHLGIMPPASGGGGSFRLKAVLKTGQSVPTPTPQVVWVNFAGGSDVRIHRRDPVSFPLFDAAVIGDEYAGHTQEMKDFILQEMRADYAAYNVTILSSDQTPRPDGPHSVVHFGGGELGLLGLADNVDNYNQNPTQDAIVYVENFAPYWTMQLEPDEMAVMIANVASHELGHLLGLYHTCDPDDIMDTTGSAWDLAENQSFSRGPLEASVFATGWEDSPALLTRIVGPNPNAAKSQARAKSVKAAVYKAIRRFAQKEIHGRCGTCLSLAHE